MIEASKAAVRYVRFTSTSAVASSRLAVVSKWRTIDKIVNRGGQMSLRAVSSEMPAQGFLNERGASFNHKSITSMLAA